MTETLCNEAGARRQLSPPRRCAALGAPGGSGSGPAALAASRSPRSSLPSGLGRRRGGGPGPTGGRRSSERRSPVPVSRRRSRPGGTTRSLRGRYPALDGSAACGASLKGRPRRVPSGDAERRDRLLPSNRELPARAARSDTLAAAGPCHAGSGGTRGEGVCNGERGHTRPG